MPASSEVCARTTPGPGAAGRSWGVQLSSSLGPPMSTQPSAGKMTSLPSPVGRVQPPHIVSPWDWAGDALWGLQPLLSRRPLPWSTASPSGEPLALPHGPRA